MGRAYLPHYSQPKIRKIAVHSLENNLTCAYDYSQEELDARSRHNCASNHQRAAGERCDKNTRP
jgi:hypothetical protein